MRLTLYLNPRCVAIVLLIVTATPSHADIFRWDNGQLIPGTRGITPGPGVQLDRRNLTYADLRSNDLAGANFEQSKLTNADLSSSTLTNALLASSTLTNANLSGAVVTQASFFDTTSRGFTQAQLASTASYQAKNLQGIGLWRNDLTGWDLSGQNLTNANLSYSTLTNANLSGANLTNAHLSYSTLTGAKLTDAVVRGAVFERNWDGTQWLGTGLTQAQLASTASYQAKNLQGIRLGASDLTGWDFSGQNLTGANLDSSTLTDAKLNGAVVTGAFLGSTTSRGFTQAQLASTASYQEKNLQGIGLLDNDLTGWDFSGQNLTNANLARSTLTGAKLNGAVVTGAALGGTASRGFTQAQLASTASYQEKNLQGIGLSGNDLTGWDFSGQNLTNAHLNSSTLTDAKLNGAVVTGASLRWTTSSGFTQAQLASTASYQEKNLHGISLRDNNLTGWDFSGQNLTDANLNSSTLTDAKLNGAVVTGAALGGTTSSGFTQAQLASTASYQAKNLQGIGLRYNDLTGWDFSGQNLTGANLDSSTLTDANLSGANLTNAILDFSTLTDANLSGANLTGANLDSSTLTDANLSGANLTGANLDSSDLENADLTGANLKNAYLGAPSIADVVVDLETTYNQWTAFDSGFDPVAAGLTLELSPPGDLDANDMLDVADLELLQSRIRSTSAQWWLPDAMFELNGNTEIDHDDVAVWVKDIKHTWFGDANLDLEFNSGDLVAVLTSGEYEDDILGNSTWASGDWDGDGDFTSTDLITALADGGYEQGPRAAVSTVPEPASFVMLMVGSICIAICRRHVVLSTRLTRQNHQTRFAKSGRVRDSFPPHFESLEPRVALAATELSISDAVLTEGDSSRQQMSFTITRTVDLSTALDVYLETIDDTATRDDYASVLRSISFRPGDTTKTVNVPIIGDTLDEADETFKVRITPTPGPRQRVNAVVAAPTVVTAADFNGDGLPDLAVCNYYLHDSISVVLNQTLPAANLVNFSPKVEFKTGSGPVHITVSDLNGDGRPDAAIANYGNSGSGKTITVLLNTTEKGMAIPNFAPKQDFPVGTNAPLAVAIGDLNGDGRPDLAVAGNSPNTSAGATVSVLINETPPGSLTPVFSNAQELSAGFRPGLVGIHDINGDGRPDLVAADRGTVDNPGHSLAVRLNTTAPGSSLLSFMEEVDFEFGQRPRSMAFQDFNADGNIDVVAANRFGGTVSVLMNTTDVGAPVPSFAATRDFDTLRDDLHDVRTVDYDGDGKVDIAALDRDSGKMTLFKNNTDPGVTVASFVKLTEVFLSGSSTGLDFADFNSDGLIDMAQSSFAPDNLWVLLHPTYTISDGEGIGTIIDNDGPPTPGDLNADNLVDATDIDLLYAAIASGNQDTKYDQD